MIKKFSFAIPNEKALNKIASYERVLEVGSGTGYWAHLIALKGADVVAVDTGGEMMPVRWFPDTVQMGAVTYLRDHDGCPDSALFMCWPRFGDKILAAYCGEVLIVVSSDLTWELDEDKDGWMLVEEIEISIWPCMNDRLFLYHKRSS